MATGTQRAIFIVGIERRSGTNFLSDLLALHADCCRPLAIAEDMLLHPAQHLAQYAKELHASWNPEWRQSASLDEIGAALGRGLLSILADQADRPATHLVTKTPRADRLALYPWLFPGQPLLVIIRDGRSLVESAVRSFGWTYGKAIERWSRGARRILEFDRDQRHGSCRYLVVRYEDLVTDLEAEMNRVLSFLRLDPADYDFDAARAMPVRGSSTLKSQGQSLHWQPVPKSSGFDPLQRASQWPAGLHRRFDRLAGMYQQLLGYSRADEARQGILSGLVDRWRVQRWQRKINRLGLAPLAKHQVIGPQLAQIDAADEQPLSKSRRRAA